MWLLQLSLLLTLQAVSDIAACTWLFLQTVQFCELWVLDRGICSAVLEGFAGDGASTEELETYSRVEKTLRGGVKISGV